ncbi:hypothetical protein BDV34DRAFT_20127 [Aspergillus parasiticus]|uniref:Uncharacterized protein n=2 Tax=Aspergillus subgen. Circumdati TaxID=2720871 RepID=A0A5N6D5L7_ASPPA|nr:hypothetical protein BDV34DRAFT_20127 [Aspergillus parasiticus]KAE8309058.1 hypothetical protein BDV41DRAFT_460822 [Aspergillus transmontanensis]
MWTAIAIKMINGRLRNRQHISRHYERRRPRAPGGLFHFQGGGICHYHHVASCTTAARLGGEKTRHALIRRLGEAGHKLSISSAPNHPISLPVDLS